MHKRDKVAYNEYMREYVLKRYNRRRENAIKQLGGQCVDCGSDKGLEFDHIDPLEKSFTLAVGFSGFSEVRIQTELKKCELRCEVCHVLKTKPQLRELGINIGENNSQHKLTSAQVLEIRTSYIKGSAYFGSRALSRKYGVSRDTIRSILAYETWKHI